MTSNTKFTTKMVMNQVCLVTFNTQLDMASTFVRFQEHYESPKFKGQIFSLDDYIMYYYENHANFDYYTEVTGFNFPSNSVSQFINAHILNQTVLRRCELDFISDLGVKIFSQPFYIIGVFKTKNKKDNALNHELAHALYYQEQGYRFEVQDVLDKYKSINKLLHPLLSKAEYHKDLWPDECHAYLMQTEAELQYDLGDNGAPRGGWHQFYMRTQQERKELKRIFTAHQEHIFL